MHKLHAYQDYHQNKITLQEMLNRKYRKQGLWDQLGRMFHLRSFLSTEQINKSIPERLDHPLRNISFILNWQSVLPAP